MTRSGRFLCPHCGNVFKSQGGLTMHKRWMHGERVEVSPVSTTLLDPRADMAKALEKLDTQIQDTKAMLADVGKLKEKLAALESQRESVARVLEMFKDGMVPSGTVLAAHSVHRAARRARAEGG